MFLGEDGSVFCDWGPELHGVTRVSELLFNFSFLLRVSGIWFHASGCWFSGVLFIFFNVLFVVGPAHFSTIKKLFFLQMLMSFFVVQINANVTLIIRPVELIVR